MVFRLSKALGYSAAGFVSLIERRMEGNDLPSIPLKNSKLTDDT